MKHRKPNRLKGYDYSQDNLYFVTSCVHDMICCFGDVVVGTGRDLSLNAGHDLSLNAGHDLSSNAGHDLSLNAVHNLPSEMDSELPSMNNGNIRTDKTETGHDLSPTGTANDS